jgi:FixJ family two-component response regulator
VLLDVQMPEMDGYDTAAHIKSRPRTQDIPIIFLTAIDREAHQAYRGYAAGAVDFLAKPFDSEDLLRAVERALEVDRRMLEHEREMSDLRGRFESLTAREQEVCFAVTDGLLNKQVGAQFGVGEKTIKVHRARVMEKMGAHSLPELVRMADALRTDVPTAFAGQVSA